jgi:hypothetical protein
MYLTQEGAMDFLVMLEDRLESSPVLAHVNSVPTPLESERPSRDVVTLYGAPDAETLALALAAAVEGRMGNEHVDAIRHLGVWPGQGATGDAAWRDAAGQLTTYDLHVSNDRLRDTAGRILSESGQALRRLLAGLAMPDWPEGARRAISFTLAPVQYAADVLAQRNSEDMDTVLAAVREGAGLAYDNEGD